MMIKFHPRSLINLQKSILIAIFCLFLCINNSFAATITCGKTAKGQAVECNNETHNCYKCQGGLPDIINKVLPIDHVNYYFQCINKNTKAPSKCSVSTTGGLEGESYTSVYGFKFAKDEGTQCITNNFLSIYTSTCYSCEIVETLASAFIHAAAKAYDVSRKAGNAILVVGLLIWISVFVLKNITSFSTVEPRSMIQSLFVQFFKVIIAFIIINSGIQTILHYTLEPIMLAGTDFGDAILIEATSDGS